MFRALKCSRIAAENDQTSFNLQVLNLLLVSWEGAPGFWKEEAASWRMGAEPG